MIEYGIRDAHGDGEPIATARTRKRAVDLALYLPGEYEVVERTMSAWRVSPTDESAGEGKT